MYITIPFEATIENNNLNTNEKVSFINLSSDCTFKAEFQAFLSKSYFWFFIKKADPTAK